jgi:membrane associated rhomboid family serine protease
MGTSQAYAPKIGAVAGAQTQTGGVAYMAHVGGFIFEAATARLFEGFRRIPQWGT